VTPASLQIESVTGTATASIVRGPNTSPGTYGVEVRATSGHITRSVQVPFVVAPGSLFNAAPSPGGQANTGQLKAKQAQPTAGAAFVAVVPQQAAAVDATAVRVVDSDAAIRIAATAMAKAYRKRKFGVGHPFTADLSDGVWHIRAALDCGDRPATGCVAEAQVRESDGRVLKLSIGQ
jgi:hypothetical protein